MYTEHHEASCDAVDLFSNSSCTLIFVKTIDHCHGDDLPNGRGMGPAYDIVSYSLTGMRVNRLDLTRDQVEALLGLEWIISMENSEAENE